MKPLRWILLISLMVMMLSGCDYPEEVRLFFTETDEQTIPYKRGKIIRFIDEQGNAATLTVSEDAKTWMKDEEGFTCFRWQRRNVRLSSEQSDLQFDVAIESLHWYDSPNVYVQTSSGDVFRVYYNIMGLLETHDSLEINRHVYYDVAVVKNSRVKGSQLCYNTEYGILQVSQDNKNIFTLVP